tara:strand:+ start:475 stop:630 length:156 start_codon:yes stop_codon:yes gene_type:complete
MARKTTIKDRLHKELKRINTIALRDPRTAKDYKERSRWERIKDIMRRRYDE